jgi:TolB protein
LTSPARLVCVLLTILPLVCRAEGPKLVRITHDGDLKQRPSWSPDGKSLVYARHRGDAITLILRELSTGTESRLTSGKSPEYDAVFSPDGQSLLFAYDKISPNQGDIDVQKILLKDRSQTAVAASDKGLSHEEWPCWSPDGKRIAFTSTRDGNQEVYVANADGTGRVRVTSDPALDAHPAWSPDGNTLAFATNRWGDLEIALVKPDGLDLRRLTHSRGLDDYPAWSADSKQLAHTSNRDGNLEIYRTPVDGGPPTNLTQNDAIDNFATWLPDGRIGFVSNRDAGFDVYVLRP